MLTVKKLIDYIAQNNIKLDTPIMGIDDYDTLIELEINEVLTVNYQDIDVSYTQILTLRDI